jgi:hypothetical protein
MIGVETTGIGQYPQTTGTQSLRLSAYDGSRTSEGRPVGAYADNRDPPRPITADLALQAPAASSQFIVAELTGSSCCPGHKVGDTESVGEQQVLFPGGEKSWSEA